jgi:para-nitrobenzyl esterase
MKHRERRAVTTALVRLRLGLVGLALAGSSLLSQSPPIVDGTGGRIGGEHLAGGGAAFKGIPYAEPPVGDLRWREPMPVRAWSGTRDATSFSAICPQNSSATIPNAQELLSEDCLYVNVWTPEWPVLELRPVLVWLPGGGNINGGTSEGRHNGQQLSRRGLVVVTVNYRLGSFGFFSHTALTAESPRHASGNQGLLDQIAALEWVQTNVARFGGDPRAVTIAGVSAGGVDISALMTSPLTRGRFARAIVQSGPARNVLGDPLPREEAERRGAAHTATWGARPGASLRELRAIPTAVILKMQPLRPTAHLNLSVDGSVLPTAPAVVFAAGRQHPVPMIMGSAARDFTPGAPPPTGLTALIEDAYGPLASRAQPLYASDDPVYGTPEVQWATDIGFRCGTVLQLGQHVRAGQTAFAFEFARLMTTPIQPGGNVHGLDGSYAFGTFATRAEGTKLPPIQFTPADSTLSDLMQQYWVNFVKTGDPNGPGLPPWPAFREPERAYVELADTGAIIKQGLRRSQCDLYIENVNRTR